MDHPLTSHTHSSLGPEALLSIMHLRTMSLLHHVLARLGTAEIWLKLDMQCWTNSKSNMPKIWPLQGVSSAADRFVLKRYMQVLSIWVRLDIRLAN